MARSANRLLKSNVLVLGGGPAGCAAAIVCAESGISVALLRSADPASQMMESLAPQCEPILERMGLGKWIREHASPYTGIWRNGSFDQFVTGRGFHVDRSLLNVALVGAVRRAGVKVFDNEIARAVITSKHSLKGIVAGSDRYEATWTIDATGRRAFLNHKMRLRSRFWSGPLLAWRGEVEDKRFRDDQSPEFLYDKSGWWWLAPFDEYRVAWTRLSSNPREPQLPAKLAVVRVSQPATAANVRWRISRPAAGNGWILAGDAAASLDPGTGQGVYFALRSGIAAAQTTLNCMADVDNSGLHVASYDQWQQTVARDTALQLSVLYRGMGLELAEKIRIQ
jgi:flavin-dependent dehydrogenase